ncbi:hypothetical protein Lal_00010319 [Lupinus albus]|uniref:Uncharacterized protein n=1 Tax=Lupinus albus TaxID=3870 RepID=A0A6A5LKK8_LUPAL|nr:hypothetical protein Lalb_Chr24g0396361 [Lupinus albus]KAF1859735.1 hypothetical protein Lal_00010319 [Lupinus albus]
MSFNFSITLLLFSLLTFSLYMNHFIFFFFINGYSSSTFSFHHLPLPILFFFLLLASFLLFKKRFFKNANGLTHNPETIDSRHSPSRPGENDHTHFTSSVLLEVLPSDSTKWVTLFDDPNSASTGSGENYSKKKRKKTNKKKRVNLGNEERENSGLDSGFRFDPGCLYPFTSSSSSMQRRIKQQYDELVKCNESNKLTLPQVVEFANSLIGVRNELQHKAAIIQRRFVITKALLCKADRSTFDRLRQQIYKLEIEQKRLEEDAFVYNSLQQQLKLSPAFQQMLEIGACMEKAKSCETEENEDDEFADISFEELLAQEKKDSFWQKNGKSRICSR